MLKKILSVVGARPNFMKVAPLHKALQKYSTKIQHVIVHTGQHYDDAMSKVFFEDLELPRPDVYLGIGSGSHAEQTAKIMLSFEKVMEEQNPDLVVVVGDVNSTVASSLVAVKLGVPVAHVEAGLRSFDRTMPEEINRLLTDAIAEHLFVTEPAGIENLLLEGIDENKMFLVGNVMIDSLIQYREKAKHTSIARDLGLTPREFVLVTLHRPSNVDERSNLERILSMLEKIAARSTVVFPVHPRTRKMMTQFGLDDAIKKTKRLKLLDPLGYLEFLSLLDQSRLVITDSGGIQEETTFLGIPCLTLRKSTERPITVEVGTNQVCGMDVDLVVRKSVEAIEGKGKKGRVPDLWDGKSAERIAHILQQRIAS